MDSTRLLEIYMMRRQELAAVVEKQLAIVLGLQMDDSQKEGIKPGDVLRGLRERLLSDYLRVLVVGRFSSGKSTFLNALMGQKILPASPTPTTGVLCQIEHAEESEKRAVLYPKPGMGVNGSSEPFTIPVTDVAKELERYVKINHKQGGDEQTSRYRKLELYWPFGLCRLGVALTDSVGLDDPESRDKITFEEVQSKDAILYCMKSLDAYSAKDKEVLSLLHSLGYRSIFFVITMYDHVRRSAMIGETSEAEFRSTMEANLLPWTDLGKEGIHYVDSLSALMGRVSRDAGMEGTSGFPEMESQLSTFLAEEKGRAKLVTTLHSLRQVNRQVRAFIPAQVAMHKVSIADLEKRYADAQQPLQTLELARRLMVSTFEAEMKDIHWHARDLATLYFQSMEDKVKEWTSSYEIQGSLGFPPRKSTIEPLIQEVVDHLRSKVQAETGQWSNDVLTPAIRERVQVLQDKLEGPAKEFVERAEEVRLRIAFGQDLGGSVNAPGEPSFLGRLMGLGYTIFTGDIVTGGLGMMLGPKAMLNTIIMQVAAGLMLGVLGLLNPIAIIAAIIGAIVAGNFLTLFQLKNAIKENVMKAFLAGLTQQREELVKGVTDSVGSALGKMRDALDEGLGAEISRLRGSVEKVLQEKRAGQANAGAQLAKLQAAEASNLSLEEQIDALLVEAMGTAKRAGAQ